MAVDAAAVRHACDGCVQSHSAGVRSFGGRAVHSGNHRCRADGTGCGHGRSGERGGTCPNGAGRRRPTGRGGKGASGYRRNCVC